jgi:hypothetical protein
MKNSNLFSILFCMSSLFLITACDNTEIRKIGSTIEARSDCVDECADCPVDDCCCSITLTEGNNIAFELCGTTDPCLSTTACGPSQAGNCTISGYTIGFTLTSVSPTQLFCVAKNSAISIKASQNSAARITCRVGQSPPQFVTAVFSNAPNDKVYYKINGDCEIADCL